MAQLENSLSLEQDFKHRIFAEGVKQLNLKQAQELLLQMHKQMLYKDNIYRELLLSQEKDIVDSLLESSK